MKDYKALYKKYYFEAKELRILLTEALPHIECSTEKQDRLINEIGRCLDTTEKGGEG